MGSFVDISNAARTPEYESAIKKIKEDGVCPFCAEHLKKYHKNPILEDGKYWLVTKNMYPYKSTKNHILFIYKEHIVSMSEIAPEGMLELLSFSKKLIKENNINIGSFLLRFGSGRNSSTVAHIHAHLVQSDPSDPEYDDTKGIVTRIG